jgi:hypothetical protein
MAHLNKRSLIARRERQSINAVKMAAFSETHPTAMLLNTDIGFS